MVRCPWFTREGFEGRHVPVDGTQAGPARWVKSGVAGHPIFQ